MEKVGKKSFVDIVITTHQQSLPWMENSTIGQFNAELDYDQLEEEFVKGGMEMVKLRYIGDRLAMLTPREGESMEALIKLNKE